MGDMKRTATRKAPRRYFQLVHPVTLCEFSVKCQPVRLDAWLARGYFLAYSAS